MSSLVVTIQGKNRKTILLLIANIKSCDFFYPVEFKNVYILKFFGPCTYLSLITLNISENV